MTLTAPPKPPPADLTSEPPRRPERASKQTPHRTASPRTLSILRQIGITSVAIALVLLGFVGYLYGLSRLAAARDQQVAFKTFERSLGQAIAPVGPTTPGKPVALLSVPAIGLHNVVVFEGTAAPVTARGIGHRRDTPLPGQAGTTVLYGRRATYGAQLAHLMRLNSGDLVQVTTGQGESTYRVSSFGDTAQPPPANSANRLILTTADSSTSLHSSVSVSADLIGAAKPAPDVSAPISSDEHSMKGAPDRALVPLALWSQVLLLALVLSTVAFYRWVRGPTWLCAVPVLLATLWNVYASASLLLPNQF